MPEIEQGLKWWIKYVVVPLFGGGGLVAILVVLLTSYLANKKASPVEHPTIRQTNDSAAVQASPVPTALSPPVKQKKTSTFTTRARPNGHNQTREHSTLSVNHEVPTAPEGRTNRTVNQCAPTRPSDSESFSVGENYDPSGKMGDTGDVVVSAAADVFTFTYDVQGHGPQEWDLKYAIIGPAKFAGVMFLNPPNNWGEKAGWDLRRFRRDVTWEARCCPGECNATDAGKCSINAEFFIGGVTWIWDEKNRLKVPPTCPDTMSRKAKKVVLSEEWQRFPMPLANLDESAFASVVGGFGWTIDWSSNGIQLNRERTAPVQPRTLRFQLRNVFYEK